MIQKNNFPKQLQGVLWSRDINNLDREQDKKYIIHQIFSHGKMEDILWLFEAYSRSELIDVFSSSPYKDYDAARFNFIKNYLLDLKQKTLNPKLYVKNTPRDIR